MVCPSTCYWGRDKNIVSWPLTWTIRTLFLLTNNSFSNLGSWQKRHVVLESSSPSPTSRGSTQLPLALMCFLFAIASRHHQAFFLNGWIFISMTLLPPLPPYAPVLWVLTAGRPGPEDTHSALARRLRRTSITITLLKVHLVPLSPAVPPSNFTLIC